MCFVTRKHLFIITDSYLGGLLYRMIKEHHINIIYHSKFNSMLLFVLLLELWVFSMIKRYINIIYYYYIVFFFSSRLNSLHKVNSYNGSHIVICIWLTTIESVHSPLTTHHSPHTTHHSPLSEWWLTTHHTPLTTCLQEILQGFISPKYSLNSNKYMVLINRCKYVTTSWCVPCVVPL